MEKKIQYAAAISNQIIQLFNPETEDHIDMKDFDDEDNLKAFIHAMATLAPCHVFNKIVNEEKNHLEFNHVANQLIVENMIKDHGGQINEEEQDKEEENNDSSED